MMIIITIIINYNNIPGGTKRATSENMPPSAPAELGGEIHNVSRNRARTQVLLQARKLHVYGSGTFGAFWTIIHRPPKGGSAKGDPEKSKHVLHKCDFKVTFR